jgi:hypothetical protein
MLSNKLSEETQFLAEKKERLDAFIFFFMFPLYQQVIITNIYLYYLFRCMIQILFMIL